MKNKTKDNSSIEVSVKIRIPLVPNFIRFEANDSCVDIADIEDDVLIKISELWTKNLLENKKKRMMNRVAEGRMVEK